MKRLGKPDDESPALPLGIRTFDQSMRPDGFINQLPDCLVLRGLEESLTVLPLRERPGDKAIHGIEEGIRQVSPTLNGIGLLLGLLQDSGSVLHRSTLLPARRDEAD